MLEPPPQGQAPAAEPPARWQGWLLLILVAGLLFRALAISVPRLNTDEGYSYYLCRNPPEAVLEFLKGDRHPPLSFLSLQAWMALGVEDEVGLRAPAAALGCLSVLLTFLLGREMFGTPVGLGAAALYAVSFLAWEYDTWLRPYGLLSLLTLASTWFFWGILEHPGGRVPFWRGAGYTASLTLLLYSHYHGFLVLGAQVFYALWRRRRLGFLAGCWALCGLLYLPWVPILATQMSRRAGDLAVGGDPRLAGQMLGRLLPLEAGLDYLPGLLRDAGDRPSEAAASLSWLATVALGLAFALGLARLRHRRAFPLLLALLAPALLLVAVVALGTPDPTRVRYYAYLCPYFGMVWTAALLGAGRLRPLLALLALAVVATNTALLLDYARTPYFRSADFWNPARWILQKGAGAQVLVIHHGYAVHALNYYYARDSCFWNVSHPQGPRLEYHNYLARGRLPQYRVRPQEGLGRLEEDMAPARRAVLLLVWMDPEDPVRRWFQQHYRPLAGLLVPNHSYEGWAEVYLVERKEAAPPSSGPAGRGP